MSRQGITLWFYGLSGSGKSTICREVMRELSAMGMSVEMLDGDEMRKNINSRLGFSYEDRKQNVRNAAYIANLLTRNGVVVLASFITPYREMREECRRNIETYAEIYVKCPLRECIRRDVKGLYRKAFKGEIPNFTGISDPFEEPVSPDLVLETDLETLEESKQKVISYLLQQES
ncbi:MAG TPA: adenylyl-sulfate kinase [Bacilli bacterium]